MFATLLVAVRAVPPAPAPSNPVVAAAPALRLTMAADTLVVTNSHPHEMTITLLSDSSEKELGKVPGNSTAKLAFEIPKGAKHVKLKASFPDMEGMEVTEVLPVAPGKQLTWAF